MLSRSIRSIRRLLSGVSVAVTVSPPLITQGRKCTNTKQLHRAIGWSEFCPFSLVLVLSSRPNHPHKCPSLSIATYRLQLTNLTNVEQLTERCESRVSNRVVSGPKFGACRVRVHCPSRSAFRASVPNGTLVCEQYEQKKPKADVGRSR